MTTTRGVQLAEEIRRHSAAFKEACGEVDEALAGRAPGDRWSPRQIISHLSGPEGKGHVALLRAFIDSAVPLLSLDAGNPFYTEKRAAMSLSELLAVYEANYGQVAEFVAGLTDEQLARTARIPELKETPLGEYPTLEGMIHVLGEYHIQSHIDHLREILAELAQDK